MLNAASVLGLDAVVLLLLVSQGIVAMPFLTNDRIHPTFSYYIILRFIASIQIQVLSLILLLYERFDDIGVVNTRISSVILLYEFGLLVCLDVILVTIVIFTTFLGLSGINVLT